MTQFGGSEAGRAFSFMAESAPNRGDRTVPTPQSRDAVPRRIPADATAQVVSVTDSAAIEWRVSWIVPTIVLAGMLAWVALEVHALRVSFADTFRLQTEESR